MKRLLAVILVLLAILPASAQVRHKFTNSIPDTPGFAGTKPSDWNDTHTMVATNAMGTIAGTTTIDWNTGWNQSATLTANVTLVLLNPVNAATYTLILTNAGGFTVTFPAEVQWPGGATPSSTASWSWPASSVSGRRDSDPSVCSLTCTAISASLMSARV